jgi:hypothetical protein
MKEAYEIADLFSSTPAANHFLTVAALAFNLFTLIRRSFYPKLMLTMVCAVGLCIPVYDLADSYTQGVQYNHNPSILGGAFVYFGFAPEYLVLVALLLRRRPSIITTTIALVCIITGWMGVNFLYFAVR